MRRGLPATSDPEVAELSALLNALRGQKEVADAERFRNTNSVHMKLANFRARAQPGGGLKHGNQAEAELWEQYKDHRDRLALVASDIKTKVRNGPG